MQRNLARMIRPFNCEAGTSETSGTSGTAGTARTATTQRPNDVALVAVPAVPAVLAVLAVPAAPAVPVSVIQEFESRYSQTRSIAHVLRSLSIGSWCQAYCLSKDARKMALAFISHVCSHFTQ